NVGADQPVHALSTVLNRRARAKRRREAEHLGGVASLSLEPTVGSTLPDCDNRVARIRLALNTLSHFVLLRTQTPRRHGQTARGTQIAVYRIECHLDVLCHVNRWGTLETKAQCPLACWVSVSCPPAGHWPERVRYLTAKSSSASSGASYLAPPRPLPRP